jgi:hypothetical protein
MMVCTEIGLTDILHVVRVFAAQDDNGVHRMTLKHSKHMQKCLFVNGLINTEKGRLYVRKIQ